MDALYSAASGMTAQQTSMDVVANNLANATTTGYKRDRMDLVDLAYQPFRLPTGKDGQVGLGAAPGGVGLRTPPGQSAGAPQAVAAPEADDASISADPGYASERDTAEWIAICRTQHDELASQVNKILDIEDRRQRSAAEGL